MSVRSKLYLFSAGPVFVAGTLLLALFLWSHELTSRAYENAMAWERHARALQNLDWAARSYFNSVAERAAQAPLFHEAESREALSLARAESLSLSRQFSADEQVTDERLDTHFVDFVHQVERVGEDRGRLNALTVKYRDLISEEIRRRVEDEEEGSASAIREANDLSRNVRLGGFAIAGLALLAAIAASVVTVRGFSGRITSLEKATGRVAAGHLEGDVPITSSDELGRLTGSVNTMLEALRHQRARQLEFLAAVAHDLKNPLGAMRLSTNVLLQASAWPPEPVVRKCFTLVGRQIERLERLVDDLLEATTIEAGKLELAPRSCDLAAVARETIELYEGTSTLHELRLSVPAEPVMVVCDPARMTQVLNNLVSNAIKYSPAGGTVDVTLTASAEEVIVSVADTGVGIEPGMFEAIFEPFRRISPSKAVLPGVGLGLAICRRIVVAHGGQIEVASELGRGTELRVCLPRRVGAAPQPQVA